jgi:hypothetical protein
MMDPVRHARIALVLLAGLFASVSNWSRAEQISTLLPSSAEQAGKTTVSFSTCFTFPERTKNSDVERIDPANVDGYFWDVFSRLPEQVTVHPSENYFYFLDQVEGKEIRGNIRLPAGSRDLGILSFAYEEQIDAPEKGRGRGPISGAKYFTKKDGVSIRRADSLTYVVKVKEREVTFHLHELLQEPPRLFSLQSQEVFVERTFDESGMQFFLLFNTNKNYFFWVLNEEQEVPDRFLAIGKDLVIGSRTGFVFWRESTPQPRSILCMVSRKSVLSNDPFDGPFDQLADNDASQTRISEWMERAFPSLRGRIDCYGYYTDTAEPLRVALFCYGMYESPAEIVDFMNKARASNDPCEFISRSEMNVLDYGKVDEPK